jgi:AcrR family transcriptional regulator
MSKETARNRLAEAAFVLFDEQGYEQVTVDEIAERAGLSRTTFFRHYRTKEDVVFPDHEVMIERVKSRLLAPGHDGALSAVADATRMVLQTYLDEDAIALRRYALTSKVPALRDREITAVARYQRVFREFLAAGSDDPAGMTQLRAELAAAVVVAAHNHVLRRWLRGAARDPLAELDQALRQAILLFRGRASAHGTTIALLRTDEDIDTLLPLLRRFARDVPEGSATDTASSAAGKL